MLVDDLQNRLQSITQQILSRTRLLLIIDKLHLYSDSPSASSHQMKKSNACVKILTSNLCVALKATRSQHSKFPIRRTIPTLPSR